MAIFTQEQIDELAAALASGVLSVEYAGPPARRVQYQSLAAMRDLLAAMIADVEGEDGSRPTYRFASHRRGFDE